MTYVRKQKDLAKALGVSAAQASRIARAYWCPARTDEGWEVEKVREAWLTHSARRGREDDSAKPEEPTSSPGEDQRAAPPADVADLVEVLRSRSANPSAVAQAAVHVAGQQLADAVAEGTATTRGVEGLAKALQELRRSEAGWLDLQARRGDLIARQDARAVAGVLGRELVEVLASLETLVASEVEIWLSDRDFLELGSGDRQRQVRAWFGGKVHDFRRLVADRLDQIVAEVTKEA